MLTLKPDLETSLRRMEAFWQGELLDRPLVQFRLEKPPAERRTLPVSPHAAPAERWLDADYQAQRALAELSNQLFLGDTLPVAWPNLGPDFFAALYGCPLVFGDYGTTWSKPSLLDWSQANQAQFDWEHPYLQAMDRMTGALLEIGRGIFLTGMTDLHPGGDCLAALRGPQNLALDLLEHPQEVKNLLGRIQSDYQALYLRFYNRLHQAGLPVTTWTPLTCQGKFYLPSNDFSALISPAMFAEFFLPGILQECRFLDRSLYHLDGPAALRHLEHLLEIRELDAIQFVPPPANEAFSQWAGVYRRIQNHHKGVQVQCTLQEIPQVMEAMKPAGLYLVVKGVETQAIGEELLQILERWPVRGYH